MGGRRLDLKAAAGIAKQHINSAFAIGTPRDLRLEAFIYDDHLMVWSLTIGFAAASQGSETRISKIVRVSEANQSVLSISDP